MRISLAPIQRFSKWTIVLAAIVVLLVLAGVWWWHGRNEAKLSFTTAVVKRGNLAATISASGTIEPVEVVDVGAQVAGQISSFGKDQAGNAIDYRSVVEEGGILARIDDSVYAADLAVSKAQLERDKAGELSAAANVEQAKAKFVQTEAAWNRAQDLYRGKVLTAPLYDTAKADYEISKANIIVSEAVLAQSKAATVQSRATVDRAQRNLDFCVIKSPVSGVIIDRRVNVGQTVVSSLNTPSLFLIARDLTKMQIWVAVNEADIGRIVPGAPVTFACDSFPGREFQGTVGKVRLNATMTQNVVMYTVEVDTENPDNLLLPYLTANVRFVLSSETNVLLVPNSALRWTPSALTQIAPSFRAAVAGDPPASDPPGGAHAGGSSKSPKPRQGTIWLKDGGFVRPVNVKLGTSDGANTAIVTDELREGQVVVTGETAAVAQAGAANPFLPKFIRR